MKLLTPRPRFRLVLAHAALCLVASVLSLLVEPQAMLLVCGIAASFTYLYLILTECRYQQIAITPLTCFLSWFGLVLGPTTVYIALRFAEDEGFPLLIWLVPMRAVAVGYVMTLLGACCLHVGLILGLPRQALEVLPERVERAELTVPGLFVCLTVSVLFATYAKSLLFIGSTFGYVLAALGPAAACMYAASSRCGFRQKWVKLLVLVPVTILLARTVDATGSKLVIFTAAIPVLWYFLAEAGRWKYLLAIGPAVAGVFVFIVAPAVNQVRLEHRTARLGAKEMIDAGMEVAGEFRDHPADYVLRSLDYASLRLFIEPVAVGYIVTRVDAEGYLNGRGFAYLAWAAIPRLLWKDKPLVSRGEWFTSETGFSLNEEASTTSTGMTSPGELFWNFGWAGVVIGMALLGYLISALLWRLALPDPRLGLIAMLPYTHILANFMLYQDSEAGSSMLNILQAYLLFALLARVARNVRLSEKLANVAVSDELQTTAISPVPGVFAGRSFSSDITASTRQGLSH